MSMSTKALLSELGAWEAFKDLVEVSSLASSVLQPEYFTQFVIELIRPRTILADARMMEMTSPRANIDRTGITGNILHKPTEGQALYAIGSDPTDNGNGSGQVDFKQNQLNAQVYGAQISIDDEAMRRNIERQNFQNTLLSLMGNAAGMNMEAVLVFGDTVNSAYSSAIGNSDAYLISNGWIVKTPASQMIYGVAHGSTYNSTNNTAGDFDGSDIQATLQAMLEKYPKPYLTNRADLRYYLPWDLYDGYVNQAIERIGGVADLALTTDWTPIYKGIPLVFAQVLDDQVGVSAFGQVACLVNPDNLVYGIFHQVTIEPWRVPIAATTYFALRVEFDCHYENENVVVWAFPQTAHP